jgi:hypothetical protein
MDKKNGYFYIITCFYYYRDRLNGKLLSLFTGYMSYLINAMKSLMFIK